MNVGPRVQASMGDADQLYQLLLEASLWLNAKGLQQWNPAYPRSRFVREIENGHVWYWAADGEAIGTVTLHERRPEYYPKGVWDDALRAWYVCRFTVTRKLVGRGLGEQLLERIAVDAAAAGIAALRLDVTCSNPFLGAYYANRGFALCHTAEIFAERCALLEKAIAING